MSFADVLVSKHNIQMIKGNQFQIGFIIVQ